jgi:hypothetical protein
MLLLTLLGALTAAQLQANGRHLAIVVDTSGSMQQNDPQRYTMQLSQVLSDLVDAGDELSVIRMPPDFFSRCSAGPSSSLVLQLDPADRASFKARLDQLIQFNTGTHFAAPIRTAISLLPNEPAVQRMLLVIADSGGLGNCESALTQELLDLKRGGVTIAAINIGGSSGAFDANPAFDFTTAALDAQGLIQAVALVYQRFLGAKRVQTGAVQKDIEVEVAPYVGEAFLVVAADGPIGAIEQLSGNPGAATIDLNHRGGGETRGLDGVLRAYRIVRLERPASGRWRFRAGGANSRGGWMLLQDSAVGARLVSSPTVPKGTAVPLEVELFDQRTGQTIADPSKIPGLRTELEVDGRTVTFRDDGQDGDRQKGDGVLTATTTFDKTGETSLAVHLQSDFLDRRIGIQAKVIEASWLLNVTTPKRAEVDRPVPLSVTVQPIGPPSALRQPERIDVVTGGPVVELRDDGRGADREAQDRTFGGTWTPTDTGNFQLDYVPAGGSLAAQASAPVQVLGRLRFGPATPLTLGRLPSESEGKGVLDLTSADARGNFDLKVSSTFEHDRSALEVDLGNGWVPLGREPKTLRLVEGGRRKWPLRLRVGECPAHRAVDKPFDVAIEGIAPDGQRVKTTIPVRVEIVPDPWLHCWWPVLVLGLGALITCVLVHGFWSPSRFSPRIGVLISPEEDLDEGFFHPIRGQRGSRSGFYRDARIYVCQDFRLAGKARAAIARLRAHDKQVRIESVAGAVVWRRTADGDWEQLPSGESTAHFGDLYRNDPGSLFFELRNA